MGIIKNVTNELVIHIMTIHKFFCSEKKEIFWFNIKLKSKNDTKSDNKIIVNKSTVPVGTAGLVKKLVKRYQN